MRRGGLRAALQGGRNYPTGRNSRPPCLARSRGRLPSWRASLNWGNDLGDHRPPGAYFELFFPVGMLGSIVTATGDNTHAGRKKPDRDELVQLFGYIMAMLLREGP